MNSNFHEFSDSIEQVLEVRVVYILLFFIDKHDLNRLKIRENLRFVGSELVVGSNEQDSLVEKCCNWNGPQEIWSPRNLGPKKFGLWEIWSRWSLNPAWKSSHGFFIRGPNLLGPKPLGTKFLGDQKRQGPKWDRGPFQYSLEKQV